MLQYVIDFVWLVGLVGLPFGLSFALWTLVSRRRPQRHLTAKIIATGVLLFAVSACAALVCMLHDFRRFTGT